MSERIDLHTFRCVEEDDRYLDRVQERDEARARVAELETALYDACCEKVVHGNTATLLHTASRLNVPGVERLRICADQIGREAKTLVSELVTALEGILSRWDASDDGMVHVDEIDSAREVLAKVKGYGS